MAGQKLNLLDVVDELSLLFERKEISDDEFVQRLNDRKKDLNYTSNKTVIACWRQRVTKTQNRFNTGKSTDSRVISIQRRFDVTYCRERGSVNAGEDSASLGATSRGGGNFRTVRGSRGGSSTFGGNNRDSNSSIFGPGGGSGGGGNFGSGEGGAFGSSRGNYDGGQGGLFTFDDNNQDGSNASGSLRGIGSGASFSRGQGGGIFGTTANGDDNQHSRGHGTFGNNDGNQEGSGFGRGQGGYGGGGTFRQQTNSGFRFHIRPELVLTEVSENDLNAALDEAEETAKKVQEGRALEAISEFYKKDAAKIWDLLLADTMQKSHDTTANEWTDVDRRVVRIAFTWSSYTTGWGKRAFEVPASPSGSAMDQALSIHSNGDSSTGNRDQSESTQASPTESELYESASSITVQSEGGNKRKLGGYDAVSPKRMLTDGFRTRSFPTSLLTSSLNQLGNHQSNLVPSQRNTGEPHRTITPASSQDVNQRHSTIQSTPGHTNPPQNDLAAPATSSPQETVQSDRTKQIIQISTSLNYCTRWLQDSKLVSVCSGNVPVIQILLKKVVEVHLCRGIDEANLTHRTTPFRSRRTSVANPPQNNPHVAEVRLSHGFSILDLDDADDKKQKIVCLDGEQEAVAVISFPADFTIYQSWVDENVHMISIPAGLVSS